MSPDGVRCAFRFSRRFFRRISRGFSLVELLVALLLGVILSSGMVVAYISAKQNALYEEELARLQENGRFALRLLSRELIMAGFYAGLPELTGVSPVAVGAECGTGNWVLDATSPLGLVDDHDGLPHPVATGNTPLSCIEGGDVVLGTDLLVVKRTAAQASLQRGETAARLTGSTVSSWYLRLASGEVLAWEKLAPAALPGLAATRPFDSYWRAVTRIFYIREYSDPDNRKDNVPTLCMETIAGDGMMSRCMVEGVEDIQFEFGVDTDGDGVPNRYQSAPSDVDLSQAVTARMYLLVRSPASVPGAKDSLTYTLGEKTVTARRDGYLRRVFSSTILLRNLNIPLRTGAVVL